MLSGGGGSGLFTFMDKAFKHSSAGHVVVVPDLRNDFRAAGAIVARLVGAFLTSVPSMLAQKPSGVQFVTDVTKKNRQVYVEAEDDRFPLLHDVLIRAAKLPGSKLEVMASVKKLVSVYKAHKEKFGARSKPWLHARMPFPADEEEAGKMRQKQPYLACEFKTFVEFLEGGVEREAVCPSFGSNISGG